MISYSGSLVVMRFWTLGLRFRRCLWCGWVMDVGHGGHSISRSLLDICSDSDTVPEWRLDTWIVPWWQGDVDRVLGCSSEMHYGIGIMTKPLNNDNWNVYLKTILLMLWLILCCIFISYNICYQSREIIHQCILKLGRPLQVIGTWVDKSGEDQSIEFGMRVWRRAIQDSLSQGISTIVWNN